jgi:cob(I)alamin adenosyltransferase
LVKLNRIYTRTGDDGTTGLVDGSRLAKHDARMEAIGAVDEANSAIGLAVCTVTGGDRDALLRVQNDLFDLGADLATPGKISRPRPWCCAWWRGRRTGWSAPWMR